MERKRKCDICGDEYTPTIQEVFGLELELSDVVNVVQYEGHTIRNLKYNVCPYCSGDVKKYIQSKIEYWKEFKI